MKTFNSFSLVALAILSLASCQKSNTASPVPDGYRKVDFTIEGLDTRAANSKLESSVSNIQVSVFDKQGNYITGGESNGNSLQLNVPVNVDSFKVCALANGSSKVFGITSLEALKASTSVLGESDDKFEMFSIKEDTDLKPGETCSLKVRRFAAKVEIDSIKDSISYNHTFSLEKIYLINVSTKSDFEFKVDSQAIVYKQYGKYVPSETDVKGFTFDSLGLAMPATKLYDTKHCFYCYPNPLKAETGTARFTRLVLEAKLNGTTYYYPVNITGNGAGIESNKLYKITRMTITGPGSLSPDVPVSKQDLTFSVEVIDWFEGTTQSVVI